MQRGRGRPSRWATHRPRRRSSSRRTNVVPRRKDCRTREDFRRPRRSYLTTASTRSGGEAMKRTFSLLIAIATVVAIGSAFGVSDGFYEVRRMHCSGAAENAVHPTYTEDG